MNNCKNCGEPYNPKEVKRVYGNLQPGYCSAGCFTESCMKTIDVYPAASPVPENKTEGDKGEGFTPGEWEQVGQFIRVKDTDKTIATLHSLSSGASKQSEAEANARLIAESKSMYYALKEILPEYERMLPSSIGLKHPAKLAAENAKAIIERINQK